jgi:spermidine synthase
MSNLKYIKYEMLTHVPVCTHVNPSKILVIGDSEGITKELAKHKDITIITNISENIGDELAKLDDSSYDVVIINTDKMTTDRVFWGLIARVITNKGIVSSLSSNMYINQDSFETEIKTAGEVFKIVMPYRYEDDNDGVLNMQNLLLLSNSAHPTADINLQRADLTDGFNYYNCDIAIGAFSLSTVIRKRFLGLIKS